MNKEELQEVLVELLENNEISIEQIKYIFAYLQGNGYNSNN